MDEHSSDSQRTVKVALLGCGVVGSQVARLLHEQAGDLAARVGAPVELVGVAVRRLGIPRDVELPEELFTTDAEALVSRGDIDVVVEVIGGIEPARTLILTALEHGASVVSANKALLAEDGSRLFEAAEKAGRDLYYEAAVAGAIPIVRPLRESMAGDQVTRVLGIVNGTTNFILDRMDSSGAGFNEALEEAQAARVRRGRPDRRRRGLRRRREGRDPCQPGLPHPRHRRRRPPRGHRRGHRERRRLRRRDGLRGEAAGHLRDRERTRRTGRLCARAPRDDPAEPPAGQRPRGVQRGLRGERGRGPADVLRAWCRWRPDRQRGHG